MPATVHRIALTRLFTDEQLKTLYCAWYQEGHGRPGGIAFAMYLRAHWLSGAKRSGPGGDATNGGRRC